MDIKRAWKLSCCLFHAPRLSHCPSKLNRQRQSPRRYELYAIPLWRPCIDNIAKYPTKGIQYVPTRSRGSGYNHTRDIYRCYAQDFDAKFARFRCVSNTAPSKRLLYVLECPFTHPTALYACHQRWHCHTWHGASYFHPRLSYKSLSLFRLSGIKYRQSECKGTNKRGQNKI